MPAARSAHYQAPPFARRWTTVLLCLLSSVLLLASFAPLGQWYLAYIALAPWALAVAKARSGRWGLLWAFLSGAVFWAAGLYWLTWITLPGYILLVLYLGLYWLAAAWLLRRAFARRWPMWLSLPVVWVALEYARAFLLGGFPWFYLAHSQYANTRLIQVSDLTGQYGVSFLVAMANGVLAELLTGCEQSAEYEVRSAKCEGKRNSASSLRTTHYALRTMHFRRPVAGAAACLLAAGGMLLYGQYRLSERTTRPGAKVGLVQCAFPNSVFQPGAESQQVFDAHVQLTRQELVGQGLDLVVWPESMLAYGNMDPSHWAGFDAQASRPAWPHEPVYSQEEQEIIGIYQDNLRTLGELVKDLGCPLLAGGSMPFVRCPNCGSTEKLHIYSSRDVVCQCGWHGSAYEATEHLSSKNSANLYDRNKEGRLVLRKQYAKMHLVPFGEYVPFREDWPWLYHWLRSFVPEEMPQLAPGQRPERFELAARAGPVRFAVPICYEGLFDRLCRGMVMEGGRKRADLLVNISNDGWFICPLPGGRYHAGTELEQHLAQYVFRAVECRVPVVRSVNTGISAHVDSNGRIQAVLERSGRRKLVSGSLVVQTLADERVSRYSLAGDVFALAVCAVAAAGSARLAWRFSPRRKDKVGQA